jgi:hypothetical protein
MGGMRGLGRLGGMGVGYFSGF